MNTILENAVHDIRERVTAMVNIACRQVEQAMKALVCRDLDLAQAVEDQDDELDRCEVAIDERVMVFLSLERPVARDLRLALTASKFATDLERVGDGAVSIVRNLRRIPVGEPVPLLEDIKDMADAVLKMFRDLSSKLWQGEIEGLQELILQDKAVDALNRQIAEKVERLLKEDPAHVPAITRSLLIARSLERVGDHCKNMAEELHFLYSAHDIRHTQPGANRPLSEIMSSGQ